jgi:hypothetical protein
MENELTDETDEWDHINFGELGREWWFSNGQTVQATTQQIIFAACRAQGMTMTGSAKAARYSGDETTIRRPGTEAPIRPPFAHYCHYTRLKPAVQSTAMLI